MIQDRPNISSRRSRSPLRWTGKPFGVLLFFFLAGFLASPFLDESLVSGIVADAFFFLLLGAALFTIRGGRLFSLAIVLGIATVLGEILSYFVETPHVMIASNFVAAAYLAVVILQIFLYIARRRTVGTDTVLGGLCVYLLMGIFWTILFINLEMISPQSFDFTAHGKEPGILELYSLLYYFSYVSLLTTGYGDVIPMTKIAQTLSVLEGLIGQFYIVFFMARLVGLYIFQTTQRTEDEETERGRDEGL